MASQQDTQSPPLVHDCLKLLKSETDEQRLAGLDLLTQFRKANDLSSLLTIHHALGPHFLDQLLPTATARRNDAVLLLSITALAAFCRVPQIAAANDVVSKIPLVLKLVSTSQESDPILQECYEFLYLVSTASDKGATTLFNSGGFIKMLASHIAVLPYGVAIKLVQNLLRKVVFLDIYVAELSVIVATLARQFAMLHNAAKFDALHLLSGILSSTHLNSARLRDSLRLLSDRNWPNYMRDGIVAILQNHVGATEKQEALVLAEAMVSIFGEGWLIGEIDNVGELDGKKEPIPADRCLLLVLEQSRVEVAVLLKALAYLRNEASKNSKSSPTSETVCSKKRNVSLLFSLVEKIINLMSNAVASENKEEVLVDENTCVKMIDGLNETIGVVLEYLQDAKEHGERKGNDLLASVRIIGRYVAETPLACEDKVGELLGYMLSVEGEDEPRGPFYSVCYLLPMLCQMTVEIEGCKALISCGGHNTVVDCLVRLIRQHNRYMGEDNGCIYFAWGTILNLLSNKELVPVPLDDLTAVNLLKALACWTESTHDDPSIVMMASRICALLLDFTSQKALLKNPDFDNNSLGRLFRLIARSLA
ncbi:uncharacterized protein LOC133740076 [Rosa rugosa]|uniref:uncharacterized protein LOC133740076 n=1 Tax=Rosa rugosa TaxID=74645 RepID=UPI002B40C67A|nr:uncharacterized protein LOC133740076 [Rosa rugosa]